MRFNINSHVRVKLTPSGHAALRRWHADLYRDHTLQPSFNAPKEDQDGWSKWQMWELMQKLGNAISMGSVLPIETWIEIIEDQST